MIASGLVSITFRHLSPEEIITQACEAGLEAIEWGGDVHVPHGDLSGAARTGSLTRQAGLRVASYGSYYQVGHDLPVPFGKVLDTALALGAPVIRVWAGQQGSATADDAYWGRVIKEARRIARLAAAEGRVVSCEYHGGSLTDTCAGARRLLDGVDAPNLRTHWQPGAGRSPAQNLDELRQVLPRLGHLHVFHWPGGERRPLEEGAADWADYLRVADDGDLPGRAAMLEFVADDDPRRLIAEATTLRRLLADGCHP